MADETTLNNETTEEEVTPRDILVQYINDVSSGKKVLNPTILLQLIDDLSDDDSSESDT